MVVKAVDILDLLVMQQMNGINPTWAHHQQLNNDQTSPEIRLAGNEKAMVIRHKE